MEIWKNTQDLIDFGLEMRHLSIFIQENIGIYWDLDGKMALKVEDLHYLHPKVAISTGTWSELDLLGLHSRIRLWTPPSCREVHHPTLRSGDQTWQ